MSDTQTIGRDDHLDDVRAAISQLQTGATKNAPPPPDESSLSSPAVDDGPEAVLDAAEERSAEERARDEKGRFVAADKAPEPKPKTEVKATPDTQEAPPQPQAVAGRPPPGWSPEAKQEWQKLSPALQQAVLKREQEVSDGFKAKSDELRRWQELEGIIAPRRSYYQKFGFRSDTEAINHLLTISDSLERDPAGTIAFLARHYNVDPNRTGAQPQAPQPQQPQNLAPQNIDRMLDERIGMQFARMEVDQFSADPKHEHFATLKPLMSVLLTNGTAKDLKEAYDAALWATPHLREQMMATQKTQFEAKTQEVQKARIAKVQRASNASLNGAPHGAQPNSPKAQGRGFDAYTDDVRAAIDSLR